jgi:ion channel-forming bestrophin family protein
MIHYDPHDWASVLANFHKSYILRRIARNVVAIGGYATSVVFLVVQVLGIQVTVQTSLFSLVGIILSLLLAFRTNSAYDRWWEGRKLWGNLVNRSRMIAQTLHALLPPDEIDERRWFAAAVAGFAPALRDHLRDKPPAAEAEWSDPEAAARVKRSGHAPNVVVALLYDRVGDLLRREALPRESLLVLGPQFDALNDILGGCERIKKTPIPFSYNTYIKQFIVAYTLALPFGLVKEFGYWTVPAVMFLFYAMMGVELMAVEIEEPFGLDCNDLPLDDLCKTIHANVYDLLAPDPAIAEPVASRRDGIYIYH